jgi:hypothetical protein
MQALPAPIPTAAQTAFLKALTDAVAPVAQYFPTTLDDAQRRSLNPRTVGPESVGFVEDAAQLIKAHPEVLPRTITDVEVAEFDARLAQFRDYTTLLAAIDKLVQPVRDAQLLIGVHLRSTSRDAHASARRDDGRTPGVSALVARLDAHLDRPAAAPPKPSV